MLATSPKHASLKSLTADQIKKLAAYLVMMTIGLAVIDGKWTSRGRTQERGKSRGASLL